MRIRERRGVPVSGKSESTEEVPHKLYVPTFSTANLGRSNAFDDTYLQQNHPKLVPDPLIHRT